VLIDEASDLASDGKEQEAIEKYRKALEELDRIEAENAERAKKQEFATVRNKRAYVNAAIDAMLLSQVKRNAKSVAVSDTTELEKKLAAERKKKAEGKKAEAEGKKPGDAAKAVAAANAVSIDAVGKKAEAKVEEAGADASKKPETRPVGGKARVAYDLAHKDYADAEVVIAEMLVQKPNDAKALNLKAALEMARGRYKEAESALDQAIMSNPRDHYAYYNMALLLLRADAENKSSAKRYYETGRAVGGPVDAELEELVK